MDQDLDGYGEEHLAGLAAVVAHDLADYWLEE